ncbi:MAG: multidrug ABC transporter ATP-binding protein [Hyphomicrobiales bacterium]|nr:ABC transporter ATP-binding protein [Hyphomicrobiales bacterium]PCH51633.1 MAG: multidrug ABC transporter ATP-binding protein [Hyphomicrobiales bacterium]
MSWFYGWFEKRVDPFLDVEIGMPPATLVKYIVYYTGQMKLWFFLAFCFVFANAAIEATIFSYIGQLIDILTEFSSVKETGWEGLLDTAGTTLLIMLGVVVIVKSIIVLASALLEEQIIVPGFFTLIRWQSHKYVAQQSLTFFQSDLSGKVAQKTFQTGHAVGEFMLGLIHTVSFVLAYAISTFALLISLNSSFGFTIAIWFSGFAFIAWFFIPRLRHRSKETAEAGAIAIGRMVDGYSNISTVKLHESSINENDWVKEGILGQFTALKRMTRYLTSVRFVLSLFSNVVVGVLVWQAIDLWIRDVLTLGEVAFTLALVLRLALLLNRLMGALNGLFRGVGTIQNSMEMIAKPLAITDKPNAPELEFKKGEIELEKIKFNYGKDGNLFDGLSLKIKPGEKIGIVGTSGAGKSTLVNLILRFFDVEKGRVLIDGQDVRDVTQNSLRSHFSMVQQETALFSRSVRENIAHGRPDASLEEIIKAAKKAKAHDFIENLEDNKGRRGYDAQIGERGVQLSGGQRQRLAIARVILRDAPILILDEATSALDSEIEAVIQENLSELMVGKTVIVIAHRLSTIAELDRLIVLDNGCLIEEGSHEQLIKSKGKYASLWKRQSGGFIGLGHGLDK